MTLKTNLSVFCFFSVQLLPFFIKDQRKLLIKECKNNVFFFDVRSSGFKPEKKQFLKILKIYLLKKLV